MSVRLSAYISATPTWRIFVKFDIGTLLRKYFEKRRICPEIRTKHSTQSELHVEFLNV
jgi:hypothetical protein